MDVELLSSITTYCIKPVPVQLPLGKEWRPTKAAHYSLRAIVEVLQIEWRSTIAPQPLTKDSISLHGLGFLDLFGIYIDSLIFFSLGPIE